MLKDVRVIILSSMMPGMDNNSSCSFTNIAMAIFFVLAFTFVDDVVSRRCP